MNSNVMLQAMRFLILALVLPSILSFFVYYGFASNYTMRNVYSEAGFHEQYDNGIYRYRVLGRAAVLGAYEAITKYHLPSMGPKALHLVDPEASDALYTACFAVNTVFMCLTSAALFFITDRLCSRREQWIGDLSLLLMLCLMALTQYVVVPYDLMSYFFLAISIFATMKNPQSAAWIALLCAAVVLCTLTRETSLLILAFYFAVHRRQLIERHSGWRLSGIQIAFALMVASFLITSALLRAYYGTEHAFYQQFAISKLFQFPPNIIGTIFFLALLAVMLLSQPVRRDAYAFLLASSPYIAAVFLFASPWETRLFCPVFLCLI
jgi:hypothetical protein